MTELAEAVAVVGEESGSVGAMDSEKEAVDYVTLGCRDLDSKLGSARCCQGSCIPGFEGTHYSRSPAREFAREKEMPAGAEGPVFSCHGWAVTCTEMMVSAPATHVGGPTSGTAAEYE